MKIEIKDTCYGDGSMKDVIFDDAYAVKVPAELAEAIQACCCCCFGFEHGLTCDEKLVATFKEITDRDRAKNLFEEFYDDCEWGTVSC